MICPSGQLVAREVAHSSLRAIGSRECAPDDRLHQGVNHKQRRSALVRITDLSRTSRHVRKPSQKPTSGRGRPTAAQPDGKRDQQQACQRKPDNRISHVIVGQMHLKRPGFRDAARKHWSLQIDVERRNPIPPERLRHREMIPGEPQPPRVLYVGA